MVAKAPSFSTALAPYVSEIVFFSPRTGSFNITLMLRKPGERNGGRHTSVRAVPVGIGVGFQHFMWRYNLNEEQAKGIMERRKNGKCDVCGQTVRKLQIDHDHETGRVRGLVCSRCNTALHAFDVGLDEKIRGYLARESVPWLTV